MGMKAAAMALMCTDAANRDALEITGFKCPQTIKNAKNSQQLTIANPSTSSTQENITDPYIRARMGLPALNAKY